MGRRRPERRIRRGPGGRLGRVSLILSVLGVLVVGLFVVSRVVTDRFGWSQWVWWVPAGWFVLVGWGLLVGSVVAGWLSRTKGGRKRGLALRRVVLIGCAGMMIHVVFGVRRYQNIIGGYGIHWTSVHGNGRVGGVRVMHWNLSAGEIDVAKAVAWVEESNVDVVLIANARFDGQRRELVAGLEGVFGEDGSVRRMSRAVVASRFEIVGSSMVYVSASGGEGAGEDALRATGDFGWVLMLRFDRGEGVDGDERLFDVWFVDLPSEPTVHRMESMQSVVDMLAKRTDSPRPALIIGDFNTVRGSGSLGLFDEFGDGDGFVDAFAERGSLGGSWRPIGLSGLKGWIAGRSSWHIDLSLVGNGWGVDGYELLMPDGAVWGKGDWGGNWGVSHRAQIVDIFR